MKLRIGTKISLGFIFVVLLMLIIAIVSLIGFRQTANINDEILNSIAPGVNESRDLQIATLEKVVAVRGYLVTGRQDFLDDYNLHNSREKERI